MSTEMLFPNLRKAVATLETFTEALNRGITERVQPGPNEAKSERLNIITKVLQIYYKQGKSINHGIDYVKVEAW